MFLETVDPITGQQTWKVADEDYDVVREIARSGFGDMIHDFERNQRYERGLKSVISQVCLGNDEKNFLIRLLYSRLSSICDFSIA